MKPKKGYFKKNKCDFLSFSISLVSLMYRVTVS